MEETKVSLDQFMRLDVQLTAPQSDVTVHVRVAVWAAAQAKHCQAQWEGVRLTA